MVLLYPYVGWLLEKDIINDCVKKFCKKEESTLKGCILPKEFASQHSSLDNNGILINKFENLEDFLSGLAESTRRFVKQAKFFPLSFYLALIALYTVDQEADRNKWPATISRYVFLYIRKLWKSFPKNMNMQILNDDWLKSARKNIAKFANGSNPFLPTLKVSLELISSEVDSAQNKFKGNINYRVTSQEINNFLSAILCEKEMPRLIDRVLNGGLKTSNLNGLVNNIKEKLFPKYTASSQLAKLNGENFLESLKNTEGIKLLDLADINKTIKQHYTKYIVFAIFDGNYKKFQEIALTNLHKWALSLPERATLELWLGPNMLQPPNLNPLKRYIKENNLVGKMICRSIPKIISDSLFYLKVNEPNLVSGISSLCEKVKFDVLGYYCNYGDYTDFVRYMALYYYLVIRKEYFYKPIYIDAPDTYLTGTGWKTLLEAFKRDSKNFQKILKDLFASEKDFGIQIATGENSNLFSNCFLYITNAKFAHYLLQNLVEEYNPFLFEMIKTYSPHKETKDFLKNVYLQLLNYYCGCSFTIAKRMKTDHSFLYNVFGYAQHISGPSIIRILDKFTKKKFGSKSKVSDPNDPRRSEFEFEQKYNDCSSNCLTWMEKVDKKEGLIYNRLPVHKYINSEHFLDYLVESTIIFTKYTNILPLSYYLAFIPLYIIDQERIYGQKIHGVSHVHNYSYIIMNGYIRRYLQKLTIRIPNNLNKIRILNEDWLEYAMAKLADELADKNKQKIGNRHEYFLKLQGCLNQIQPVVSKFEESYKSSKSTGVRLYTNSSEIKPFLKKLQLFY